MGEILVGQLSLATERKYSCSFIGSMRAKRFEMVEAFKNFPNGNIIVEGTFLGSRELFKYGSVVRV